MNADPKAFRDAIFIKQLGYDEVIEMALRRSGHSSKNYQASCRTIHPHCM
jgi:hypothetical protein